MTRPSTPDVSMRPATPPTPPTSRQPHPAARVTVLRHEADVGPERFDGWLTEAGVGVRIVALDAGEPVPSVADLDDGLVVLGGRMNALADDDHPRLPAIRALLAEATAADVPVLGICLGHQLLAAGLGGTVEVGAAAGGEEGLVEVLVDADGAADPVLGLALAAAQAAAPAETGAEAGTGTDPIDAVLPAYASHHDTVSAVPDGAVVLATSRTSLGSHVQAMRVGSALGVQFHPEADPDVLERWFAGSDDIDEATARRLVAGARAAAPAALAGGEALARAFAAQVLGAARNVGGGTAACRYRPELTQP